MTDLRDKRLRRVLRALKAMRQREEARLGALKRNSEEFRAAQATAIEALNDDTGLLGQRDAGFARFFAEQIRKNARNEQQANVRQEQQRRKVAQRQGQEKIMENMINRLGEEIDKDRRKVQLGDIVERYSDKVPASNK